MEGESESGRRFALTGRRSFLSTEKEQHPGCAELRKGQPFAMTIASVVQEEMSVGL